MHFELSRPLSGPKAGSGRSKSRIFGLNFRCVSPWMCFWSNVSWNLPILAFGCYIALLSCQFLLLRFPCPSGHFKLEVLWRLPPEMGKGSDWTAEDVVLYRAQRRAGKTIAAIAKGIKLILDPNHPYNLTPDVPPECQSRAHVGRKSSL